MSNKEYYERWLNLKKQIEIALAEDRRIQELATNYSGVLPQGAAVEFVAKVYARYCDMYNKLCDCYDQMEQVQRRPYIKNIIDAVTCRLLELKTTLEEVEVLEFTYPENALQKMLMTPQNIQLLCPFFYPFEIRKQENQYIMDQIFAGNRLGDPEPTPSEKERAEEERLEKEMRQREEKEAEIKRMIAMGEEIPEVVEEVILTPAEIEEKRLREEYEGHINHIQRMERSRVAIYEKAHKINQDKNVYLELAGLKKPQAKEEHKQRAAALIQFIYRRFMQLKRDHHRQYKTKLKLGMIIPSWHAPSAKVQLERVKEERRKFRRKYYEDWLNQNIKETSKVLRLRENDIMDDITAEINQWLREWYKTVRVFDEFPWPKEGGSILIVQGKTFTLDEYLVWQEAEIKKLKENATPKTKEQIKAEKQAAKEEKKQREADAALQEKKRLLDYKKSRLNPEGDPGVYFKISSNLQAVLDAWNEYQIQWKNLDSVDAPIDVIRGYIKELVIEEAYKEVNLQLRPIVDDVMRMELKLLNTALKFDYYQVNAPIPPVLKRKKPKNVKIPKPEKISTEFMFQELYDKGIIKQYPKITLDDYWGDQNYAAADMRAILWTPLFPPACLGDVREQVRVRCLLTLGCNCKTAERVQLLVGPKSSGKRTLVYAIATETNAVLIDLSPMNVYNKYLGSKQKQMLVFASKISKLMQPSIILVDNADKMFYAKVPKEEIMYNPTRLQKDFYKEIVKPIEVNDRILVLGTASEPWLAKGPLMYKLFPSVILLPRTDYGSLSFILTQELMKYHGVNREFNVHSTAQALTGYDLKSIRKGLETLMSGKRVAALCNKPLQPTEIINAVLNVEDAICTDNFDLQMFQDWFETYSPMGERWLSYKYMLETQLKFKLKAEKK